MSKQTPKPLSIDANRLRFGIAAARFNAAYVDGLLADAVETLVAAGASEASIDVERTPGSNELPVLALWLARRRRYDAIVALGAVIEGGTRHFEMVADSANWGLQRVALETGVPVVNGVIVGRSEAEAEERCLEPLRKGRDFGQCALEMAALGRKLSRTAKPS